MKTRPRHYEDGAQRTVIQWAGYQRLPAAGDIEPGAHVLDYLYAVPNGGERGHTEAARLIGLGVAPGVSDLVLALARGGRFGLYLELKKDRQHFRSAAEARRAVSLKQRVWLARMDRAGYRTAVAYGADEACAVIRAYVREPPTLIALRETPPCSD